MAVRDPTQRRKLPTALQEAIEQGEHSQHKLHELIAIEAVRACFHHHKDGRGLKGLIELDPREAR